MQIRQLTYIFLLAFILPSVVKGQESLVDEKLTEAREHMFTDPVKALQLAESALELATEDNDKVAQGQSNKILVMLYAEAGRYAEALSSAFEALNIYQELGNAKEVCRMYIYLGIVYKYQVQFDKSLEYYLKADEVATQNNFDTLKTSILGNTGNVYLQLRQHEKALEYHEKALAANQKMNSPGGIASSIHNIGMVYRAQGLFEQAINHYSQSLAYDIEQGNQRNICLSYIEFMEIYIELENFPKALQNAQKALQVAEEVNSLRLQTKIYEHLPLIQAAMGNYDSSISSLKKYQKLSDSLQTTSLNEEIAEMQTRFDTREKEKELEIQQIKLDTQQSSLNQQKLFIIGLIVVLILAALSAYLLFNRYKLKQRSKRMQLELETKNIKQLDQMKSQFFANISHEFRTPLNLILAPLQSKKHPIPPQELDMMRRNAGRLLRLVNQLLDLARIEVGLMKPDNRTIEVSSFLNNIAVSFSPLAEIKSINYQIDIPERDYFISTDPDKLEKIVYNLLSNAFKFTPEDGKISIHLSKEKVDKIRLSVSDTGIGINKDLKAKIFERFYQIDASQTREYEGSGIGLALTKELIDLLGGEIHLDSQQGKGSTFTIIIPASPVAPDESEMNEEIFETFVPLNPHLEELTLPSSNLAHTPTSIAEDQALILFVEDNSDLRQYVKNQLGHVFRIQDASNGIEGLEIAKDSIPDLIISDVMMPKMDGVAMTKQLRQNELTSHIPIILLTARDDGETKIKGFETGAEQYLLKPFQIDELKARIESLLLQRKRLHEKFGREVTLAPKEVVLNNKDATFIENLIQIVEDNLENESFSIEQLQKEVGVSRMQLHRKLKGLVNQSAGEFVRTIKLKRAAQLLSQPGMQVTEVAYQSGFNHLSYFAKCFKEFYGVSPSHYAENQAKLN